MAALRRMQRDEQQITAEARGTGDLGNTYLLRATDAQIAAAEAAIDADGTAATRVILSELKISRSIYMQHAADFRGANGRRATLLKQNGHTVVTTDLPDPRLVPGGSQIYVDAMSEDLEGQIHQAGNDVLLVLHSFSSLKRPGHWG